ncbi:MAG: diguanylate cyclase [Proteobacteria bacterium]|nr:diguanylate cyclase [Pseudomonadota bacterium]
MSKSKLPGSGSRKAAMLGSVFSSTFRRPDAETKANSMAHQLEQMKSEIALLTSYASDTVYRLRYETMSYDYISQNISRLLGFTPQEMMKLSIRSLILETRIVTNGMKTVDTFEDLEKKRKEGDVNKWQADYLMRTKDGRKIWVSDVSHPWFDEHGTIIGSIGSLRDITDRVEAENRVKEELSRIANTDALTGLSNRRQFFSFLEMELKRIQRNSSDVSILLLDVDHFKRINDGYGHDVGDRVLIELAKIIKNALRETDFPARIGGEEFAIMLPDTPAEGAYWVAERVRLAVLKHGFEVGSDKEPVNCTVSVGVASSTMGNDLDASALYKMADTRLYIAKNTGRNQVSVDEILHTH